MRINELLAEQEQLDELNLKGLGQGIGKAVGAVAGGVVQGAKNVWSGVKQGYQSGQDALSPGEEPTAATGGNAPAKGSNAPASGNVVGGEVASNNLLARAQSGTTQDPNAQTAPASNTPAPTAPAPTANTTAPAPTTTPAPAGGEAPASPAADQTSKVGVGQINKIIPTLRTRDLNSVKKTVDATLVKKQKQPAAPATAPAAAPAPAATPAKPAAPTQAELDADHERMASGTNENKIVRFESRFLGMMI